MSRSKKRKVKQQADRAGPRQPAQDCADQARPDSNFCFDRDPFFQLVLVSPLIISSWVSGGLLLQNQAGFMLLFAVWALAYHSGRVLKLKEEDPLRLAKIYAFSLLSIGTAVGFFYATDSAMGEILFVSFGCVCFFVNCLEPRDALRIQLYCFGMIIQAVLSAVLGVAAQSGQVLAHWGVLGLAPGMLLASSVVAQRAQILESNGWRRLVEKQRPDSAATLRPGGVTQLFSLLFFVGSAFPLIVVPFGLLPLPFLLGGFAVFFAPSIAESFFFSRKPDINIYRRVCLLAALVSVANLVAGLLVR